MQMENKTKKSRVAVLMANEIDFKTKAIRDKEGHCIITKGTSQQEDICKPNIGAPKCVKQI